MSRELATADLRTIRLGGEHLVTTLPWGLLRYPRALELPLAVATLVVAGLLVGVIWRRGVLSLPRTAVAAVVGLVAPVVAGFAGHAAWRAALLIDPGQASAVIGDPYRPVPYQVATVLTVLGTVLVLYALVRRRLGPPAVAVGSLLVLALLGVLLALTVQGVGSFVVLPTLPAVLGVFPSALLPRAHVAMRGIALALGLVPAAILIGPAVWTGFEVGLALGAPMSAVLLTLLLLLALPLVETAWPMRTALQAGPRVAALTADTPAALLVLGVAATAVGLAANREGSTPPRQEMVSYSLNAATGGARWVSPIPGRAAWSRFLLSDAPAQLGVAYPWSIGTPMASGPAPPANLPPPKAEVISDVTRDGVHELKLRLRSRGGTDARAVGEGPPRDRPGSICGGPRPSHARPLRRMGLRLPLPRRGREWRRSPPRLGPAHPQSHTANRRPHQRSRPGSRLHSSTPRSRPRHPGGLRDPPSTVLKGWVNEPLENRRPLLHTLRAWLFATIGVIEFG